MPISGLEKRKIASIVARLWGSVFDFAAMPALAAGDAMT
jgi:hypothetical protein